MTDMALQPAQSNYLQPVAELATLLRVYQAKKEFIEQVFVKDVDFGVIPNTTKSTLLKAGAEKATSFFGLTPTFEDVEKVEDWTGENHNGEMFFYYRQRCNLWKYNADGTRILIASADGSCNSWEKKYRYRSSERICPQCSKPTIIKGKPEYTKGMKGYENGGYVCFAKKGGCGAKFADRDPAIEGQQLGQIKNPDIADVVNTTLKISQKRALVASTLIGCGLSDYFTQDMEDFAIDGQYTEVHSKSEPIATKTFYPAKKETVVVNGEIVANNAEQAQTEMSEDERWEREQQGQAQVATKPVIVPAKPVAQAVDKLQQEFNGKVEKVELEFNGNKAMVTPTANVHFSTDSTRAYLATFFDHANHQANWLFKHFGCKTWEALTWLQFKIAIDYLERGEMNATYKFIEKHTKPVRKTISDVKPTTKPVVISAVSDIIDGYKFEYGEKQEAFAKLAAKMSDPYCLTELITKKGWSWEKNADEFITLSEAIGNGVLEFGSAAYLDLVDINKPQ